MLDILGKLMVQLENVEILVWQLLSVASTEIKVCRVHESVKN